ncbi:MAG TPA: AI-2E family transporter [Gemmatimonadaceae bacterium]|nr:AI-2E family transporter [Gemmatimonadaceae bacterium]
MSTTLARRVRFAPLLAATILTVLLLWLLGTTADIFLLLFVSILISLYLSAVTDILQQRLRVPRTWAFIAALAVTVAAVGGLLWLLVPPVIEQTQALIRVLPQYMEQWESSIERSAAKIPALGEVVQPGEHRLLNAAYEQVANTFEGVVPRVFSILHAAISFFSVVVMSIYLTLQPGVYREWLIALFPPLHRDLVRDVLSDLGDQLRKWIVGQLLAMLILAVLTAIGLYFLKVPYWLTFGVFTGAVAIIPFFGTLVSTILPALFVLNQPDGAIRALLVVLLGVVIHALEANIVLPRIMSRQVELPPVLTILTVLVVGKLLGGVGLIVAVPLLATIMVVVRRILINRIYEGQGFRRTVRDRALLLRVPVPEGGVLIPVDDVGDVLAVAEDGTPRMVA